MARLTALAGIISLISTPIFAQQATVAEPSPCDARASSNIIHVAVCGDQTSKETLADEGRRICDGALPCGVWFWRSEADMPESAPENHDGLSEAEVTSAIGVWVAEQETFIGIEPVAN